MQEQHLCSVLDKEHTLAASAANLSNWVSGGICSNCCWLDTAHRQHGRRRKPSKRCSHRMPLTCLRSLCAALLLTAGCPQRLCRRWCGRRCRQMSALVAMLLIS